MLSRRALSLVAVAAASLASIATSPQRWDLPLSAGPFRVRLDAEHPTVTRTFTLNFARNPTGATPGTAELSLNVSLTAARSGVAAEPTALRVRVLPASVVASGAASPPATEHTIPFAGAVFAGAQWNAPYTRSLTETVTVVFERTRNPNSGVVDVTATLSGQIRALGELPPGARVTLTESQ